MPDIAAIAPGKPALIVTNRSSDAYKLISAFLGTGVQHRRKLYVALHNNISLDLLGTNLKQLTSQAFETFFEEGDLAVVHAPDLYLEENRLDLKRVQTRMKELCQVASRQGYAASHLLVDLGWARDRGLVDDFAEAAETIKTMVPQNLYRLDVCYVEDYTVESMLKLIRGYDQLFFQNGTVAVSFQQEELRNNEKLVTLLQGALTDTAALIKSNRDTSFISRLSAETAYKRNLDQITDKVLALTSSYLKADIALLFFSDKLDQDLPRKVASLGIPNEDATQLAQEAEKSVAMRHAVLSHPKILMQADHTFNTLAGTGIRVLVLIPLVDRDDYFGFLLLGAGKPRYGQDFTHDLMISIARTVVSAYRMHQELVEIWSTGGQYDKLRAAGEMVGGITHGFNNALASISAYAQLIEAKAETSASAELAGRIRRSVSDAAEMVQRVQLLLGGGTFKTEAIGIADLAAQVVDLTRPKWETEPLTRGCTLTLHTDYQSNAPVQVNQPALREAITNLIINACEALGDTSGEIIVRTWETKDRAYLSVTDSGPGVAPHVAETLFQPFLTTKSESNTGLGLAIVKQSVEAHDGSVKLQQKDGSGATFIVELPRAGRPAVHTEDDHARQLFYQLASAKVLIVDDDELVRDSVSRLLQLAGGKVECVTRPSEAVARIGKQSFDLVICDFALPELTGLELAQTIRQQHPQVPLVLLTGWVEYGVHEAAREVVDLVLTKPLTIADTLQMTRLVDTSQSEDQQQATS